MTAPRIVGVIASARRDDAAVEALTRRLGGVVSLRVRRTRDLEEGIGAAEALAREGVEGLVAVGGDGAVLSVLPAALASRLPIAVLPTGTANDLARHAGLTDLEAVCAAVLGGRVRRIDACRCSFLDPRGAPRTLPFATGAGVGVLAAVTRLERTWWGERCKEHLGAAAWIALFAAAGASSRDVLAEVRFDDVVHAGPLALLEVCKVRAPGGFVLAPDATLDSGRLDAWLFGGLSRRAFWSDLARGARGDAGHLRARRVHYVGGDPATNPLGAAGVRRIEVRTRQPLPVQVSGEHVGTTPATFEVLPGALSIFVP